MSPQHDPEDDGRDPSPPLPTERHGVASVAGMLGGVFARATSGRSARGVPCGVEVVDRLLGGFRPRRVTVVGASTSWGKSSFGVMTVDVGLRVGARILLVSGEDSEDQYGQRLMARRAQVNAMSLRDGNLKPADLDRMADVVERAERSPLFLDGVGKTVEKLAAAIGEIVEETTADLVIVDYLQAFGTSRRTQDRRNEVTHVARTFTDAIKRSGAAGILFSQMKRLEDSTRPTMHDLKESGDVENMAEHVLIGYWATSKGAVPTRKRYMVVEKNKDGPVLDEPIEMPFNPVTASFLEQRL